MKEIVLVSGLNTSGPLSSGGSGPVLIGGAAFLLEGHIQPGKKIQIPQSDKTVFTISTFLIG